MMHKMKSTAPDKLKIPTGIWVLGFVSMLMDTSSELIHSLLPVFLLSALGASALTIGLIEGAAEAVALIVKVFSGTLSDYLGKRKLLTVIGYSLGALSKPLFALATTTGLVFTARFIDRIGKGIRGAPRDALVADLSPPEIRGAAFGLRQSLDTIGAFAGPLIAVALMLLWANDFSAVFWVAVIPAVLAVLLLLVGVREPDRPPQAKRSNPIAWHAIRQLGRAYWWVVGIGALFTLARFSEAFLVLRAVDGGLPLSFTPFVLVLMNVVYSISAYPFGRLSDRMSHTTLLAIGLLILAGADLSLALATSWEWSIPGIALWGLHLGITQGLFATMVADTAPIDLRGTAYGFFNLFSGIAMLVSSVLAGALWDFVGPSATFQAGAVFCGLALGLTVLRRRPRP
jgi:MFS family permease